MFVLKLGQCSMLYQGHGLSGALDSVRLMVTHNDFKSVFQLKGFCDSMILSIFAKHELDYIQFLTSENVVKAVFKAFFIAKKEELIL